VSRIGGDNRAAAERMGLTIFDRTRMLAEFPQAGRVVPEERHPNVREIVVEPYRVIYELNANRLTVDVLRVWHAARGRPEAEMEFSVRFSL
jgi:plasmid stabilization system protein ParE